MCLLSNIIFMKLSVLLLVTEAETYLFFQFDIHSKLFLYLIGCIGALSAFGFTLSIIVWSNLILVVVVVFWIISG